MQKVFILDIIWIWKLPIFTLQPYLPEAIELNTLNIGPWEMCNFTSSSEVIGTVDGGPSGLPYMVGLVSTNPANLGLSPAVSHTFLCRVQPWREVLLTLKQLGHLFLNVNSNFMFYLIMYIMNAIIVLYETGDRYNTINIYSALWILMAWCFSTRAHVATVLSIHPCVSSLSTRASEATVFCICIMDSFY